MQQTQDRQPDPLQALVRKLGKDGSLAVVHWLEEEYPDINSANGVDDLYRAQGLSRWLAKRCIDIRQLAR